jgi:hypothetical protein
LSGSDMFLTAASRRFLGGSKVKAFRPRVVFLRMSFHPRHCRRTAWRHPYAARRELQNKRPCSLVAQSQRQARSIEKHGGQALIESAGHF